MGTVKVGGKRVELKSTTIKELVLQLKINEDGIAIIKNGHIIKKQSWETESVNNGDEIEIFSPVSGG